MYKVLVYKVSTFFLLSAFFFVASAQVYVIPSSIAPTSGVAPISPSYHGFPGSSVLESKNTSSGDVVSFREITFYSIYTNFIITDVFPSSVQLKFLENGSLMAAVMESSCAIFVALPVVFTLILFI